MEGGNVMPRLQMIALTAALMVLGKPAVVGEQRGVKQLRAPVQQLESQVSELESELGRAQETIKDLRQKNGKFILEVRRLERLCRDAGIEPAAKDPGEVPSEQEEPSEFVIEPYEFTWTVAQTGDVELRIEKTEDTLLVGIMDTHMHQYLSLRPASAEQIGQVLGKADEYYRRMRGSPEDVRETVKAGKCEVSFWNSPQYGFSVSVKPQGLFAMTRVSLERKQALQLAPHLLKAQRMAEFVDRRVNP